MKKILVCLAGVLSATLAVAGLLYRPAVNSTGTAADAQKVAEDGYVKLTFRGLMVFSEIPGSGRIVARLHMGARHHNLRIRIKGPGYYDFLDWSDEYEKDADINLTVNGSGVESARWGPCRSPNNTPRDPYRPYRIAHLHSSDGDLRPREGRDDKFLPTFTVNSGTFCGEDPKRIEFFRGREPSIYADNVPTLVIANIVLTGEMTADLSGSRGSGLIPIRMHPGQAWTIDVTNNPDLGSVCEEYHFVYYYKGFRLRRRGGSEDDVDDDMRYRARSYDTRSTGGSPVADPCNQQPPDLKRAIETRPCIPVSN